MSPQHLIRAARTEDAAVLARVHVATWRSSYGGLIPQTYLDRLDVADLESRWRSRLSLGGETELAVVEVDGEVVGYASGGPERERDPSYEGELYGLYLLPAWQRQGIGRALVARVAGRLMGAGMRSMLVWVLAANAPARGFYEHLGGAFLREHGLDLDEFTVREVAYGWGWQGMAGLGL
ncbi:MAG: GNAT family N-acetyltransferase [Candidatus Dormibacteraceae bacterium]